ncbi:MAG: hypothetical protein IJO19_01920, partial [Clostridia bacterium]|nr:hypothetical protein [Clostridia bacterium]
YTEKIKATGHKKSVEWVVTVEPTCTEKGVKVKYCTDCNEILKTEEVSSLGHTVSDAVVENNVVETCTQDGSYDSVVYCSVCGAELSREQIVVKAFGHTTVTKNVKSATCFEAGYTGDKVCSVCGETITKGKAIAKLKLKTPKMTLKKGTKLFKVKYKKVSGATGFQVKYKTGKGKWVTKTFNTKKTVTKTIKQLKKGKKYTVKIRAFVKSGSKKAYSSWSKTKSVKVK